MTHCYNYLQMYFLSFYEFTREEESKIMLMLLPAFAITYSIFCNFSRVGYKFLALLGPVATRSCKITTQI